jgi:DNA modification methylase
MKLLLGDSMNLLKEMGDNSVDSIVTDPPYGLSFMSKKWDYDVPSVEMWKECLRVLKPGGHLLAFAGTRTQHRMAVNIEDAGFEIRDMIAWVYGSGFPKSLNVSKAIDKAAGAEREVVGYDETRARRNRVGKVMGDVEYDRSDNGATITAPATEAAQQWEGWGTALKPALEPITMARKPLIGTIVENVLEHGTGGLNIEDCRIGGTVETWPSSRSYPLRTKDNSGESYGSKNAEKQQTQEAPNGRFPANFIHDGSDEVVDLLGDKSRFFYCPKASNEERNAGCENITPQKMGRNQSSLEGGKMLTGSGNERSNTKNNFHPTVKPVDLMRYLCRLVTPSNGVVLDPFMGSGTTGVAAKKEGFEFIGMEREGDYYDIASARINNTRSKREWI